MLVRSFLVLTAVAVVGCASSDCRNTTALKGLAGEWEFSHSRQHGMPQNAADYPGDAAHGDNAKTRSPWIDSLYLFTNPRLVIRDDGTFVSGSVGGDLHHGTWKARRGDSNVAFVFKNGEGELAVIPARFDGEFLEVCGVFDKNICIVYHKQVESP